MRGGNCVLVALRVSGDEFIVTGKRGCLCVYVSAGNRKAQSRMEGQSFYLLGVIPPYDRELSEWQSKLLTIEWHPLAECAKSTA